MTYIVDPEPADLAELVGDAEDSGGSGGGESTRAAMCSRRRLPRSVDAARLYRVRLVKRYLSSRIANRTCYIGDTSDTYAYWHIYTVRDIRCVTTPRERGINLNALSLSARVRARTMTRLTARNRFSYPSRV